MDRHKESQDERTLAREENRRAFALASARSFPLDQPLPSFLRRLPDGSVVFDRKEPLKFGSIDDALAAANKNQPAAMRAASTTLFT